MHEGAGALRFAMFSGVIMTEIVDKEFLRLCREFWYVRRRKLRRRHKEDHAARRKYVMADGGFWRRVGAGWYSEVWQHDMYPDLVMKMSGRAGWGDGYTSEDSDRHDGWPTFARYCLDNPHEHLPTILHLETMSRGMTMGIMPRYAEFDPAQHGSTWWRAAGYALQGCKEYNTPEWAWIWPIQRMASALKMQIDLHEGNLMVGTDEYGNDTLIITDPFSTGYGLDTGEF